MQNEINLKKTTVCHYIVLGRIYICRMKETCSSGEPNERHCTSMDIAPALRAASTGGNSDLDNKRLSSRRAVTFFCIAPFPLR